MGINNKESNSIIITASGGRLGYYFLNIVILISVPYLVTKYHENPTLIVVLIGILIIVLLPFNLVEYFFVEESKLVVLYKCVFFLQFLNRKRIFKFDEIEKIIVTLRYDRKTDIASFITNLTSRFNAMALNILEVEMKNGKKKTISTQIYKDELLPIINYMQSKVVNIEFLYPNEKDFL